MPDEKTKAEDRRKVTPSQCKYLTCFYNQIAPPENSQECVSCGGLVHPRLFRKVKG